MLFKTQTKTFTFKNIQVIMKKKKKNGFYHLKFSEKYMQSVYNFLANVWQVLSFKYKSSLL